MSRCRPACPPSPPPTSRAWRRASCRASRCWRWLLAMPARWPGCGWCAGAPARHRHPLWKSLVLPAGGVALCWLLLMTLWLPLLDYARSYRPLVERIARARAARRPAWPHPACRARQLAALEYHGRLPRRCGHARREPRRCDYLLQPARRRGATATHRAARLGSCVARDRRDRPTATRSRRSTARAGRAAPLSRQRSSSASRQRRRRPPTRARAPPETPAGSVEPLPSSLWISSSPPWRCTTCLTIDRPRPGAAGVARTAAVDAVEAFGQARQVLAGDAEAGVAAPPTRRRRRPRRARRTSMRPPSGV